MSRRRSAAMAQLVSRVIALQRRLASWRSWRSASAAAWRLIFIMSASAAHHRRLSPRHRLGGGGGGISASLARRARRRRHRGVIGISGGSMA